MHSETVPVNVIRQAVLAANDLGLRGTKLNNVTFFYNQDVTATTWTYAFSATPNGCCVVRTIDEDFVHDKCGYCYFSIRRTDGAWVYNLYVEPEHRRQGHARRLLIEVICRIRSSGYMGKIRIRVEPREGSIASEKLEALYRSVGLEVASDKELV
jgi:GNAT superfamily N-acetyltransferase